MRLCLQPLCKGVISIFCRSHGDHGLLRKRVKSSNVLLHRVSFEFRRVELIPSELTRRRLPSLSPEPVHIVPCSDTSASM